MGQLAGFEDIYKHAPIGLAVLDSDLRFLEINHAMAEMNGLSIDRHLGRAIGEILPHFAATNSHLLRQIFVTGEPQCDIEVSSVTPKTLGMRRYWMVNATPIMNDGNTIQSILISMVDITQHKGREEKLLETLSHREIMFLELSHRTSNNLRVIRKVLAKQAQLSAEPSARLAYSRASHRLHAASMVHGRLYQPVPNFSPPDAANFVKNLFTDLTSAFTPDQRMHDLLIDCDPGIYLSHDKLISLGMILTELVTDIWNHAYATGTADIGIYVGLHKGSGNLAQLIVRDDGTGLSQEFDEPTSQGLGMKIVMSQAKNLRGTIMIEHSSHGSKVGVTFPLEPDRAAQDSRLGPGSERPNPSLPSKIH